MNSIFSLKKDICEVGKRVYDRGYVAANDGNISVRLDNDRILCTPTGVSKGYLTEEMLAVCDLEGKQISGSVPISSEIRMHLEIYKLRDDISSVVHAHPPTATGFAVAGIELTKCVLPEVIVSLGGIPLAEYGTPGGVDIVEPMKPLLKEYDAILMANHGVVTLGTHVMDAHFKMETVEHFAKIALVATQLGSVNTLSNQHVDELIELRNRFGIVGRPACDPGDREGPKSNEKNGEVNDLVEQITKEVMGKLKV
ncbi:MAG: class II aldolase/adducin family protein [Candidatus Latescibacterota bacterium]|nr:class II aldolase/adducin family protein [Candidatus Latescibacterota bacterium]